MSPVVVCYFSILGVLCLYGAHRLFLVVLYHRHNKPAAGGEDATKADDGDDREGDAALPVVTVQLPLYNERLVVERLLESIAALDYPRDRLQIQILDDSTDDTREICAAYAERLRERGLDVEHRHRTDRTGFKAGALEAGLATAKGELLAVFDADFTPQPAFLRDTVGHFADAEVGMVQARWGHLNASHSRLTRVQAIFLDAHFLVEHFARNRSGRFINFNGTAGVWRRGCIEEAGGWQHDTLTEDLDLSFRAQLAGWRFVFLPDIVAPAELPVEMDAFKSQQYRWTKGSVQVARKMLPKIWRARVPARVKLEATVHLTANVTYLLMVALALLLVPAIYFRSQSGDLRELLLIDLPVFFFGTLAVCDFFLTAQRRLGRGWRAFWELPLVIAIGMGLALNNARAVVSALFGRESPFVRTPKYAIIDSATADASPASPTPPSPKATRKGYSPTRSALPFFEVAFGVFFAAAAVWAAVELILPSIPFLALFSIGFFCCGLGSLVPRWRRARVAAPA